MPISDDDIPWQIRHAWNQPKPKRGRPPKSNPNQMFTNPTYRSPYQDDDHARAIGNTLITINTPLLQAMNKKEAVKALKLAFPLMSNVWIASLLDISHQTVKNYANQWGLTKDDGL